MKARLVLAVLCSVASSSDEVEVNGVRVSTLFLKLNAPEAITKNGQRTLEIGDVVRSNMSASSEHRLDGEGLTMHWEDGSSSFYSHEWLSSHVGDDREGDGDVESLWGAGFGPHVPRVAFGGYEDPEGLLRVSTFLVEYGLVVMADVPTAANEIRAFGDWLGHVRVTNYGDVFDVRDDGADAVNLAYTNVRIRAHTDNPYRDPYPGVQLLHCLETSSSGGATTFTDGFAVAERLRVVNPAAFDLLATVPHPFEYVGDDGVLLRASVPVLTVDPMSGRVTRVALNNRSAGKLKGLSPEALEAYYAAWAAFDDLANGDDFVVRFAMRPGDLAVFLNSRVMHGREAFQNAPGSQRRRHLQGIYVDQDAIRSRVAYAARTRAAARVDAFEAKTALTLSALASQAQYSYGEGVDMLQHALQAADVAARRNESVDAVVACLLHDVGNAPQARDVWRDAGNGVATLLVSDSDGSIGYANHSDIGAHFLAYLGFPRTVANAVGLHVPAKRALVAMDPEYMAQLSQASIDTLKHQGGPMSPQELADFHATPGSDIALRLRKYDDLGKVVSKQVPQLPAFETALNDMLRATALLSAPTCA